MRLLSGLAASTFKLLRADATSPATAAVIAAFERQAASLTPSTSSAEIPLLSSMQNTHAFSSPLGSCRTFASSELPTVTKKQRGGRKPGQGNKAAAVPLPVRMLTQGEISPSIAKGKLVDELDPVEFMVWLKERFMRQDLGIPDGVKEVIFRNHWDKVLVDVKRTVKVTRSGKLETYHAIACVGNFEGLFGVGIASSNNSQAVVGDAYLKAYQNLVPIPLYRGHTIYHRINHKFHTVQMLLMPRSEGFGIKCNDVLHELCTMIGIQNISIKVLGRRNRRNKFNVVKCFLEALQTQTTPHDGVEMMGVYAREVFHRHKLPLGLQRGVHVPA